MSSIFGPIAYNTEILLPAMGSIVAGISLSSLGRIHTGLCNTMNTERTASPFMQIKFPSIKGWFGRHLWRRTAD